MAIVYKKKPTKKRIPLNHDPLNVVKRIELLIDRYEEQVEIIFATATKQSEINAAVKTLAGLYKLHADTSYDLGFPKKMFQKYEEPKPSPIRDQILYNMELDKKIEETEREFFEIMATDYGEDDKTRQPYTEEEKERLEELQKEFLALVELRMNPGKESETLYPLPLKNPEDKKYPSH